MDVGSAPDRHEFWMRAALAQAAQAQRANEVPIGAVVVFEDTVVGAGFNRRESWRDGTAHAELIALQEASRRLNRWRLTGCSLYVTLEPCPMCAGAIMLSRVSHLVYGAADPKGGAIESKVGLLTPGLWNHTPNITSGILDEECAKILKDFFRRIRTVRTDGAY
ncbi:tRNA adenosine(34) deaminase TadA [Alicyclobacillus acidiphilus]|uniref:tRNA adenosine(34) deaminase TadA n=1 Tax=Alicyclobacillus acidiphilus TaxID=182455 RepID=UPI00082BD796|nr:tRNA adenosine(34) deaminase TadA [Alicyclobacillus acidiphilus]